jgi:hypothetical protein
MRVHRLSVPALWWAMCCSSLRTRLPAPPCRAHARPVSRPSAAGTSRSILTEIYLCHARSHHEIEEAISLCLGRRSAAPVCADMQRACVSQREEGSRGVLQGAPRPRVRWKHRRGGVRGRCLLASVEACGGLKQQQQEARGVAAVEECVHGRSRREVGWRCASHAQGRQRGGWTSRHTRHHGHHGPARARCVCEAWVCGPPPRTEPFHHEGAH